MTIYGTQLFGHCDRIEGVGYVATAFAHIASVPILPLGSYLVLDADEMEAPLISIALSARSVAAAWSEVLGTAVASALATLGLLVATSGSLGTGLGLGVLAALALYGVLRVLPTWLATWTACSEERRAALLASAGLADPDEVTPISRVVPPPLPSLDDEAPLSRA